MSDLANLAEIVGAVAIVISLIYVGQELRANTAAVQAASLQSITNSSSASMLAVFESGEFAWIRLQCDQDPSRLSGAARLPAPCKPFAPLRHPNRYQQSENVGLPTPPWGHR